MLRSGIATDVKVGKPFMVDAGAAGGMAECAPVPGPAGATPKNVNCGWISDRAAWVMSFAGFGMQSARALVPQILAALLGT
jgi:hypothetical protein